MRRVLITILVFIMLGWIWADFSHSRSEPPESGSSGARFSVLPNAQNRAHTAGNLWLSISNWGVLGSRMRDPYIPDPETGEPLPSSAFPGDSDLEYLWLGSIWIGAAVNDTPYVSMGFDGWFWIQEFSPDSGMSGAIVENEWWGDQEFIAVYADTFPGNPWIPWPDPWGPRRPLNVKTTQHSYSWQTPGYDDFVILDYTITNIGTQLLSEVHIGFYMDTDIQHVDEHAYGEYGAQDDMTGFLRAYEGDTVNIAWAADNDGHGDQDGGRYATEFTAGKSPTAVVGMRLLGSSTPVLQLSYNWWNSHMAGLPRDWGPWLTENQGLWAQENCYAPGDSFFPDHVLGTPGGDCSKHFILSNGEIDYDQIYTCVDQTAQGWLPPNDTMCGDFATGFDTRFLFSFGPFDPLAPGDSLRFAIAWVAGDSFHVDPTNLAQDPQMTDPDRYYSNLNFSKLVQNSETALLVYQSGYTLPPPGPPKNLKLMGTTDSTVELCWSPKAYHSLFGYNVYRSTVPGEHNEPPVNSSIVTDTVFQDSGLQAREVYYYAVSSLSTSYVEGGLSPDLEITVGKPTAPAGLTAESQKDMVTLSWQHNPEDDLIGYKIYRTEDCSTYVFLDSVGWQNIYVDQTVLNGTVYYYRISAVDSTQLESFPSDTVYALPMAFDQGILVLDQTNANTFKWDYQYGDSVDSFYSRALASYGYAVVHHDSCGDDLDRVSLPELSPYQVCILHCEDAFRGCYLFDDSCEIILKQYLRAGGKLILEGRDALFFWMRLSLQWNDLGPYWWFDFPYNWLRLDAVYRDRFIPVDTVREFVGARSEVPEYPDLDIDTSRVNSSIDPGEFHLSGILPGIGYIIPRDWQETIYTFHSAYSDTSSLEGMPVALRHLGADHQVIFFCFPLYFIQEDQATQLLHQALADLGVSPTDVPDAGEDQENVPTSFSLKQNYPNPFNPQTVIDYDLPMDCEVEVTIYNILGQKVRTLVDEFQKGGKQRIEWDGKDEKGREVSSGVYFYRIKTPEFIQAKKMVLLK